MLYYDGEGMAAGAEAAAHIAHTVRKQTQKDGRAQFPLSGIPAHRALLPTLDVALPITVNLI